MKGIVLIAVGHPYYGRMAFNLAATLKACNNISIALIYDDRAISHLLPEHKQLFDFMISSPIDESGMNGAMRLRLMLPKLSPFKETLSLDVDTVWIGESVQPLFDLLVNTNLTYANEGYFDLDNGMNGNGNAKYITWASIYKMVEAYNLKGCIYQMRGELILFKKDKVLNKVFDKAAKIQQKPLIAVQTLGNAVTEEFALNIAINQAGLKPHISRWQPTFWPDLNGHLPTIAELKKGYLVLSAGGNSASSELKKAYDIIVSAACYKLGLKSIYKLQAKQSYLTERITR